VTKPLISIVLPVFNGEDFIDEAIQSVLSQTQTDIELIIVNDCSTDGTSEIVGRYMRIDSRIILFENTQNLNLPSSLNVGFSVAKGLWHTWISHDNSLEKDFLEKMYLTAIQSNADIVYGNYKQIGLIEEFGKEVNPGLASELYLGNTIGASFLYKSSVFRRLNGYDITKFMYEDYAFWAEAYLQGFKYCHTEYSGYQYRIHRNQLTKTRKMPREFLNYRLSVLRRFQLSNRLELAQGYLTILRLAVIYKNLTVFMKVFLRLLLFHLYSTIYLVIRKLLHSSSI
jgi:glycosyltransferase involved in cell wall biosynthesis